MHELPALRESDLVRVKPNPRDKTPIWRRGQIISKQGERSYLVDVNGRDYQRNWKFLHATSELQKRGRVNEMDAWEVKKARYVLGQESSTAA